MRAIGEPGEGHSVEGVEWRGVAGGDGSVGMGRGLAASVVVGEEIVSIKLEYVLSLGAE